MKTFLGLLLIAAILCGCGDPTPKPGKAKAGVTKIYDIKGTVLAIDLGSEMKRSTIKLDHQDIPGFMKAMTMDFNASPLVLEGLKVGDFVHGKLEVTDNNLTITELRR